MKRLKKSKAFTFIEVIVSIIVLGIVMSTIPILMAAFTPSLKISAKEEVFFSEFSLLSLINTKYFDENNTIGDNYYKDLNASAQADSELSILKFANNEYNRIGKHYISQGKMVLTSLKYRSGSKDTLSNIGPDAGESDVSLYDDIDDFNNYLEHHAGITTSGYDINVKISYIKDDADYTNGANISFDYDYSGVSYKSNIKLITISTRLNDGTEINLTYPTCNIGASAMLSYK